MAKTRTAWLAALLLASLMASCSGTKKEAEEEEPPTPVQVDNVTRGPIDLIVEADAVLNPINQASVTPKLSAPVRRVFVNRGDHVRVNQLVAELESRDLTAAAAEARTQIDQAEATLATISGATVPEDRTKSQADVTTAEQTLEAAKRVYESRLELQKQGALARKLVDDAKVSMVQAQSQYDTAKSHLEAVRNVSGNGQINVAKAQLAAAKAHYESAMVAASYSEIRTPIAGIVSDRPVYPG